MTKEELTMGSSGDIQGGWGYIKRRVKEVYIKQQVKEDGTNKRTGQGVGTIYKNRSREEGYIKGRSRCHLQLRYPMIKGCVMRVVYI